MRVVMATEAASPGHEAIRVVLYFWDARDGEGHSGWWFGDSVGGSQVWSRNPSNAWSPPKAGWRVPWNGEESPGLLSVVPQQISASAPAAAASAKKEEPADSRADAEAASIRVAQVETDVRQMLATIRAMLAGTELSEVILTAAEELIASQTMTVATATQ